jgi:Kef-type K+ transport system membrane component KefB
MQFNILLYVAIAMAVALVFNRFAKLVGLPNVTGYLIAGLLIGGSVLNIVPRGVSETLNIISDVALGFIAFSIGGEFKLESIKKIGGSALTITFFQSLSATLFVDVALLLLGFEVPLAITLGAIATATAPAATLMVVRQYKAKGPVTQVLLPVVALDDAVGLVVFAVSMSAAHIFADGAAISVKTVLVEPLIEIIGSLAIGAALGAVVALCMKLFASRANRLSVILCAVLAGTAIADMFGLSSLLLCMSIGALFANLTHDIDRLLDATDVWTAPLFMLFFVLSGADLDLSVLPTVGLLGVAYILARSLGKYIGTFAGSAIVHADKNIRNYLGVALLPQAGVAIGMSHVVASELPAYGAKISAVVLSATLIFELVGPLLTKAVLIKAGEITLPPKAVKGKG